jgi:hypothetical protein
MDTLCQAPAGNVQILWDLNVVLGLVQMALANGKTVHVFPIQKNV